MRPALFSIIAALSGLSLAQPLPGPVGNIVAVLTSLTAQCQTLMAPANQLSIINAPLMLLGAGPWTTVLAGFTDMAATLTAATSALPPNSQLTGNDALAVTDAFRSFSTAQTALLNTVAQAGGVVDMLPIIGPPVASAVEGVSAAVEASLGMVTEILGDDEDSPEAVEPEVTKMRQAIQAAIQAFS